MNQITCNTKLISILVLILLTSGTAHAVKVWQPLGPSPIYGGQPENIPNKPQLGAINAIAPHPTDSNILYVATVAGGIWKTENAMAKEPFWQPIADVTDNFDPQEALSTSDISFDPSDSDHLTIVVSYGRLSSFGNTGGLRMGVIRSVNGGATWTKISGGTMVGKNINSVISRNNVIMASVDAADINACDQLGIFRSNDAGVSWAQVVAANGLVQGRAYALEADPVNSGTYYASVNKIDCGGAQSGVYKTTDFGISWNIINSSFMNTILNTPGCIEQNHIKISVGRQNNVYAGIICDTDSNDGFQKGALVSVHRSGNGGSSWAHMATPRTTETDGVKGIHPGGQGFIHRSIVADPINANIVYVGGDRQPSIPSTLGNADFSGRIFRGDASLAVGSQWSPLTHSGTASNTAPHADSRDLMFDAAGTLLESDDGGIYRILAPRTNNSDWISVHGNLQVSEIHSSDYDSNTNTVIAGLQDNGTSTQPFLAENKWKLVLGGDGGDVAVDAKSLAAQNQSIRYTSSQELGNFNRQTFDQNNQSLNRIFYNPEVIDGGASFVPQFLTPFAINDANPLRMIIGGKNSVYESVDQGETISEIGAGIQVANFTKTGTKNIAYGNNTNENILYIGGFIFNGSNGVFVRTTANGTLSFKYSTSNAATGGIVNSIVVNDNNDAEAFLVEDARIMRTTNHGDSWTNITGNIDDNPLVAIGKIRSIEFIDGSSFDALIVGTDKRTFKSTSSTGYLNWEEFGAGMPPVPVYGLEYNKESDVLLAGTMGRGEYIIKAPLATNDAPLGIDREMNLLQGSTSFSLNNGQINLTESFSDFDESQTLTLQTTPVNQPSNGILALNSDGTFSYQHDGSMTNSDEFYYKVCDNGTPILCNDAKVSVSIDFGTDALVCSSPNLDIPDNDPTTGVTDTLTMMQSGLITDLEVGLEINHTYVSDLNVKLIHVSTGTEVILIDFTDTCSEDNISAILDDNASSLVDGQCGLAMAIQGRFKPFQALSAFNNLQLAGNWNLNVTDSANQDVGALISWCLDPVFGATNSPPVLNPIGDKTVNENTTLSFIATATDPDTSQGNLVFSLNNAPTGASITSGGNFSFTPTSAQGPNAYAFDVIVSDDSSPALTDSETITVTVNEVADPTITVCNTPNLPIPDDANSNLVNTINIPDSGTITDIDVSLNITHTWVGDLDIKLMHVETGTEVRIVQNPGGPNCEEDDILVNFGDQYSNTTTTCQLLNGDFQPQGTLGDFNGELLPGAWNLTLFDSVAQDDGTLNNWCIKAQITVDVIDDIFKSGFE